MYIYFSLYTANAFNWYIIWLILFSVLFTQSRTNQTAGTSKDFSSSKSSTLPTPAKAASFERSTSMQTLPSPTKKKSLSKRSITFADLPPSLKESSNCNAYPSRVKSASPTTGPQIRPLQDTFATSPPRVTSHEKPAHARFRLPPTPLTAPECSGDLDTSASFSKRQIARSVDGKFQVEVGFRSMSNY